MMELYDKICKHCGNTFKGTGHTEFCPKCRDTKYEYSSDKVVGGTYKCENCGTEFIVTSGSSKYCEKCREEMTKKNKQKAVINYKKKAYDRMEIRFPKGEKERITNHAEKQGESLNQFFVRAVNRQIEEDSK
jgi:Zn finger protein HypA/HybF involved in hydrogenase expression